MNSRDAACSAEIETLKRSPITLHTSKSNPPSGILIASRVRATRTRYYRGRALLGYLVFACRLRRTSRVTRGLDIQRQLINESRHQKQAFAGHVQRDRFLIFAANDDSHTIYGREASPPH